MASTVKAHDELTLTYRLEGAGGEVLTEKTEKQKGVAMVVSRPGR
jgi:hypothetical protein